MIIPDSNLLLYSYNSESPYHPKISHWWSECLSGSETIGLCSVVLFSFVRIITNPRFFSGALSIDEAIVRVDSWFQRETVELLEMDRQDVPTNPGLPVGGRGRRKSHHRRPDRRACPPPPRRRSFRRCGFCPLSRRALAQSARGQASQVAARLVSSLPLLADVASCTSRFSSNRRRKRAVAQLGRALPWGGRGRGFKSRRSDPPSIFLGTGLPSAEADRMQGFPFSLVLAGFLFLAASPIFGQANPPGDTPFRIISARSIFKSAGR